MSYPLLASAGKDLLKNPEAIALISDSALKLFFGLQGGVFIQWMAEHIQFDPNDRFKKFRWMSTAETSNLNKVGLMPPILSMAARLADAGADTAEAAFNLAQKTIETQNQSGLVGSAQKFLFGG